MTMDDKRSLLRHFLAALAYRTQKALRDAPLEFDNFQAADGVRTPVELVRHMTSVLGYARTYFTGGHYRPEHLPSLKEETIRFHATYYCWSYGVLHGGRPEVQSSAFRLLFARRQAKA